MVGDTVISNPTFCSECHQFEPDTFEKSCFQLVADENMLRWQCSFLSNCIFRYFRHFFVSSKARYLFYNIFSIRNFFRVFNKSHSMHIIYERCWGQCTFLFLPSHRTTLSKQYYHFICRGSNKHICWKRFYTYSLCCFEFFNRRAFR